MMPGEPRSSRQCRDSDPPRTSQTSALSGQTALVTGSAARLGRATALALAAEGANVVVHYGSSAQHAEQTAEEVRRTGAKAWALQADLAKLEGTAGLFQEACRAAGPIDILVNNASIFDPSRLDEFTPDELMRNVQVNAMAPLLLGRALAAQGRPGVVVNFLDSAITRYDASHAAYHLSKRMLFSITRMMALEFAPKVRVNAVAPGLILPPAGKDESYLHKLAAGVPLRRTGATRDVTDAVLFLVKSGFVTGQVIFVDGGHHMNGCVYG